MAVVSLSPIFNGFQAFTSNGVPLAGGLLNTYLAGGVTPVTTYTDSAGSVANSNPIQLDSAGRPPSEIWIVTGAAIKFVLTDSAGANSLSFDNIRGIGDLSGGITDITTTGNTILGDATTDTLNVGANGLVKDASGNVLIGGAGARLIVGTTSGGIGQLAVFKTGSVDVPIEATNTVASTAFGSNNSAAVNAWGAVAGTSYIGNQANQPFVITTSTVERFRVSGSSGDITALGIPISRTKSATTTRTTTTTFSDDPHLVAPLGIGTYSFDIFLTVGSAGTGGFKTILNFTGTQTSNSMCSFQSFNTTTAMSSATVAIGTGFAVALCSASTPPAPADYTRITGHIVVTVAGNLSVQWAQNSSNGSTSVGIGSWMNCTKVA